MRPRTALGGAAAAVALAQFAPAALGINGLPRIIGPAASGVGRPGHIALTFDDGPDPAGTDTILAILADYRVTATFFVIAEQVAAHPAVLRRTLAAGHEIGLHGDLHRPLPARGLGATAAGLSTARRLLCGCGCGRVSWYRPPYGAATGTALATATMLGMRPVWWTAWGRDWSRTATCESIAHTVTSALKPGGTILLHDSDRYAAPGSWRHTAAALPHIITAAQALGCDLGPLRDHW